MIAKVHMVKYHISLQLHISGGIRVFMVMLPGPETGSLLTLRQFPSGAAHRVHQFHIALVHFGSLIHELKHPVRTRQRHDNAVKLHADLVDGHIKGFVKIQETGKSPQSQARHTGYGKYAAHHGADHIA